jgi:hypothetical protein
MGETGAQGDGDDAKKSRPTLVCSQCRKPQKKQELLLDGPEADDWQGHLPLVCWWCTTEEFGSWGDFLKQVEHRWKVRAYKKGNEARMMRSTTWEKVKTAIDERFPGETRAAYRARVKEAFYMMASLVATWMMKLDGKDQHRVMMAFREFESSAVKQSLVGEHVPDMNSHMREAHGLFWCDARITEYCDLIVAGVAEHFLCRQRSCLSFTLSTSWIEEDGHSRYRCPTCGVQYAPWSMHGDVIGAQKVMVCHVASNTPGFDGGDGFEAGELRMYMMRWSDTKVSVLKNRLKEVMLQLSEETRVVSDPQLLHHIRGLVAKGNYSYMKKVELSRTVIDAVDHSNASAGRKKWRYDHIIAEGGYLVAQVPEDTPIIDELEQVRMWALARYALEVRTRRGRL